MSVVIIWSETVYMIPSPPAPLLSIIGITFHAPGVSYATVEVDHIASEWVLLLSNGSRFPYPLPQMLSVMFLLYMCLCAMFSLFRVRLFDTYSLHPDHNTSEVSLCWFTSYMCRLTFPLCYNFTNMAGNKDAIFSKVCCLLCFLGMSKYVQTRASPHFSSWAR